MHTDEHITGAGRRCRGNRTLKHGMATQRGTSIKVVAGIKQKEHCRETGIFWRVLLPYERINIVLEQRAVKIT